MRTEKWIGVIEEFLRIERKFRSGTRLRVNDGVCAPVLVVRFCLPQQQQHTKEEAIPNYKTYRHYYNKIWIEVIEVFEIAANISLYLLFHNNNQVCSILFSPRWVHHSQALLVLASRKNVIEGKNQEHLDHSKQQQDNDKDNASVDHDDDGDEDGDDDDSLINLV